MGIAEIQGYASIFMTIILVIVLYSYIYYLYSSEKKGVRDFEKYGNIAIDDNITSEPVEDKPASQREYKE